MAIKFVQHGDFSKFEKYIRRSRKAARIGEQAEDMAKACIEELKRVTPKDTGLTSESWTYEIIINGKITSIIFNNTNIQNGINIALLLEMGHATASGSWVEGQDYIEPTIRQTYLTVLENKWKEMTKL